MKQTSNRMRGLMPGGDDGWDIFHRARALRAAGVAITDQTVGDHDIGTDASILDAMAASARCGHTGYAALAGTDGLRDAIAARVTDRTGVQTLRQNVLMTTGEQAALFADAMAATDPGGRVLFPDPHFTTYPGTIRAGGGLPVPVTTRPEDGFQPTRAALDAAGPANALLITSPNNPAGAVYRPETLANIAGVTQDRDVWLMFWGEAFEADIAAPFRARRDACLVRIATQAIVGVIPSGGAMYLMLDIRRTGMPASDFALRLLLERRIAVMPGGSCGAAAAGHQRLALTQPAARLIPALDTIPAFAKEMTQ